jgi:hypothetical protein
MSKSSELDQSVKRYIIANIIADGYQQDPETIAEKISFLNDTFLSEYGFNIARYGKQGAIKEWLQGLPSAVALPYMNCDVITLAVETGGLEPVSTEKQAQRIVENYFNFMAAKILQLFDGYRVPKTH